jgi:uncharacterized protein YndB with AHSA1/START domain
MNDAAPTELVITRIFDAPRELVYRAFTEPEQLAAWFGPVGWSVPLDSVSIDARPGGHQRFTMVNDEDAAQSSPLDITIVEAIENELLVGEGDASAIPEFAGETMRMRLEFHDEGGTKTRLVLRQGPYSAEMEPMAREGWGSSFTKLDALFSA